ncbi:hypothetical protein [Streptomyces sp. XY006]|uniref:hypothetical protein n=1 Tax=Streptomyces sp. XY006 TaxID=2021410 RepID=UPI001180FBF6|nr:hypothetical protein [Streptomyces sp. XY006]
MRVRPVVTPGTAGTSSGPFGPDGETFDAATDVRLVGDEEVPALDAAPRLPVRTGVPIPLLHPGATGRSSSDRPAP